MPRLGDDPLSRRKKVARVAGPQDALFVPSLPLEVEVVLPPIEVPVVVPTAEGSGTQTLTITVPAEPEPSTTAPALAPLETASPRAEAEPVQEKKGFFGRIFGKFRS